MAKLLEADYSEMFSPEILQTLKGKSGESLRQMLGNKTLRQTMLNSQQLIMEILIHLLFMI